MTANLLLVAIVGYTLGIAFTTAVTVYRSVPARKIASALYLATWVVHLAAVVRYAFEAGRWGPSNLAEFLLGLGWGVVSLHLFVWFRLKVHAAGLVLPPFAAMCAVGAQALLGQGAGAGVGSPGGWFIFHTTAATMGLATLCLAFAMSVIYLLQDRALKNRRTLRWLERLPALETCDTIGFQALLLGFFLLTLGIATGMVINESLWVRGIKQIFPVLAWMVFAFVLMARVGLGIRGRKTAFLTILGFLLGLFTVVGIPA